MTAAQATDADGNTPLHLLVSQPPKRKWVLAPNPFSGGPRLTGKRSAPISIIRRLVVAHPAAASVVNAEGLLPVRLAVEKGAPSSVISVLLETYPGAASDADDEGRVLLHFALTHKAPLTVIQKIINVNPDALEVVDEDGLLPIHIALAVECAPVVVEALLAAKPSQAKHVDAEEGTLLHFAAYHGCPKVLLNTLMHFNRDAVGVRDGEGMLPLHRAVASERSNADAVAHILQANPTALRALAEDNTSVLQLASTPRIATLLLEALYADADGPSQSGAAAAGGSGRTGAITDAEPPGARDQLITLLAAHVDHAAWPLIAAAVMNDTAPAEDGTPLPRSDRHYVASALFALHGTKVTSAAADESKVNRPMSFGELHFLCGSLPDPTHWSPQLIDAWCMARGWRAKAGAFAKAKVGGPKLMSWVSQDGIDGFDLGDSDGLLQDGLASVGSMDRAEDRRAAIEEIADIIRQRRIFEERVHLEPLFGACAVGSLRSVLHHISVLRDAAAHASRTEASALGTHEAEWPAAAASGTSGASVGSTAPRSSKAASEVGTEAGGDADGASVVEIDLDFTDLSGNTPLAVALFNSPAYRARSGAVDGLQQLAVSRSGSEHAAVAMALLAAGAGCELVYHGRPDDGDDGRPLLHMALSCALEGVSAQWLDVAGRMLERGSDVNTVDATGHTALHLAVDKGDPVVCQWLLERGCLPERADCDGVRPAHLLRNHDEATVAELVKVFSQFVQVRLQAELVTHTVVRVEHARTEAALIPYLREFLHLRGEPGLETQGLDDAPEVPDRDGDTTNPMHKRGAAAEPRDSLSHEGDLTAAVAAATSEERLGMGGEVRVKVDMEHVGDFRNAAGDAFRDEIKERAAVRAQREAEPLLAWERTADGESVNSGDDTGGGEAERQEAGRDSPALMTPRGAATPTAGTPIVAAAASSAFVPPGAVPIAMAKTVWDKLNALLWLLEEVNPLRVPVAVVLLRDALDYNTPNGWKNANYRILFLCQGHDPKLVPEFPRGYDIHAPGDMLREIIPACQVAASILMTRAMLEKYTYTQPPEDSPGLVDVPPETRPGPGLIQEGARVFLFRQLKHLRARLAERAAQAKLDKSNLRKTSLQGSKFSPLVRAMKEIDGDGGGEETKEGMPTEDERASVEADEMRSLDVAWEMVNAHKDKFRRAYAAIAKLLRVHTTWRTDHMGLVHVRRADGLHQWVSPIQAQSTQFEILSPPDLQHVPGTTSSRAREQREMAFMGVGSSAVKPRPIRKLLDTESALTGMIGSPHTPHSGITFDAALESKKAAVPSAAVASLRPQRSPVGPLSPSMYVAPNKPLSRRRGLLHDGDVDSERGGSGRGRRVSIAEDDRLPLYMTYSGKMGLIENTNRGERDSDALLSRLVDMQRQHRYTNAALRDVNVSVRKELENTRKQLEKAMDKAERAATTAARAAPATNNGNSCSIM